MAIKVEILTERSEKRNEKTGKDIAESGCIEHLNRCKNVSFGL
jgi:hypothetical protein